MLHYEAIFVTSMSILYMRMFTLKFLYYIDIWVALIIRYVKSESSVLQNCVWDSQNSEYLKSHRDFIPFSETQVKETCEKVFKTMKNENFRIPRHRFVLHKKVNACNLQSIYKILCIRAYTSCLHHVFIITHQASLFEAWSSQQNLKFAYIN